MLRGEVAVVMENHLVAHIECRQTTICVVPPRIVWLFLARLSAIFHNFYHRAKPLEFLRCRTDTSTQRLNIAKILSVLPFEELSKTKKYQADRMHLMYSIDEKGRRIYTLQKVVGSEVTKSAHTALYSHDDKYSR